MPNYSYLRINSNGDIPMDFVNLADIKKDEEYQNIRPLFSHHTSKENDVDGKFPIYLNITKYSLWCSDGKRYNVQIYFDEDGLSKKLLPNHRANAMVDAGRFTSKKFDYIGKTRNQEIKEAWGSGYFVGDVIMKFTTGKPIPDCSIFGENPINFIMDKRLKKPNTRMINKHGEGMAELMFNPFAAKRWDTVERNWEKQEYRIIPTGCEDTEYLELLKSWGM